MVVAITGYVVGVRRLAARRRHWPQWRTACFAAAVTCALVATCSSLPTRAAADPSQGALADVLLLMAVPLLLAWAAPHLLVIESGSPRSARRTRAAVSGRPLRVIGSLPAAWLLFAAVPAVLYTTSLHATVARHELLRQPLQLALVVIGCLFLWPVFGADPVGRRLDPGPALAYLLGLLPYFTLLGMAVEARGAGSVLDTSGPVAAAAAVGTDLQGAGGILWTAGGLGSIVLVVVVLVRWLRLEERAVPGRGAGLDPAAVAQLIAWREQRDAAAAADEARRVVAAARRDHAEARRASDGVDRGSPPGTSG